MRAFRICGHWRKIAAITVSGGLAPGTAGSAAPSFAAHPSVTGVVGDTSGAALAGVTVGALDPLTTTAVTATTTGGAALRGDAANVVYAGGRVTPIDIGTSTAGDPVAAGRGPAAMLLADVTRSA
jgi:hypothetical protein